MSQNIEVTRMTSQYSNEKKSHEEWLHWGPYLSERQWGTVREDYSQGGNAWDYFSHDQSRSRAYRWGEDGLGGISDPEQRLCFAIALWNGQDPILKERLFGLTNGEGNHGEDVKEYYYYLDNTPTHSYMKWLYKYPQKAFPYNDLVTENGRRKADPHSFEYELMDTGVFNEDRYFDVQVEYAKSNTQDILIKIKVTNHGPEAAPIHILPTFWFRNTWSWFLDAEKPILKGEKSTSSNNFATIKASSISESTTKDMMLYCEQPDDLLFVENETNNERLWGSTNNTPYPKDGINDHIIANSNTINPALTGTKSSAVYATTLASNETKEIRLRLSQDLSISDPFSIDFDVVFTNRLQEADEFYESLAPTSLTDEQKMIQRQAYAGMLWGKQYYNYVVADWLDGDPAGPKPPPGRGRNKEWRHMYANTIISMPDTWEYPWFAAWDLCFQCVVFARLDLQFAKNQLLALAHEWYMAPNGAIPAYEWAFSDVNPPLHAWAALTIFEIEKEMKGSGDTKFIEDIFEHCLMNFTWWTNQQDTDSSNLFEGGFLGLDNISVINRSNLGDFERQIGHPITLKQSDGTSWMGMYCINMMQLALILAEENQKQYSHFVSKFFQHFVFIADSLNSIDHASNGEVKLWDEEDGFYYDFLQIHTNPTQNISIKLRSLVGIIPLFPVAKIDLSQMEATVADELKERLDWFVYRHPELLGQVQTSKKSIKASGSEDEIMLSFVKPERLTRILERVLDEAEFLGPHGIRGISKHYQNTPYSMSVDGAYLEEKYEPAESADGSFGGNSNWRGPVWFPINFLFINSLRKYDEFLESDFTVEYPSNSGNHISLSQVADELSKRLIQIFEKDANGNRPVYGGNQTMQNNPTWQDLILFFEYFHGDNGAGLGASHQTGWTGLVAELLSQIK
ncbi:MGH1-like glycoside hydrolase domain-containing protein [Aquimarina pacifica]|uniref:MGH1-like glycoside hydrolase domain-containing protein n=1 Tax=Aquimarina pacifica TaxID=1296415 RepID=UPI0004718165|nr:glucosidase [Aquimarina pacifica]